VVLPWSAQQLIGEVDEIFKRAEAQPDLQVQSDYAKYLVIRVSGLVEQVVTEIVLTYVATQASQPIAAHVSWRMGTFQNPNIERVLQLVGSFDRSRRTQLEAAIEESEKEALGSVRAQRNRIAHGEPSTVSLTQVCAYYVEIKKMLNEVASHF
jgi:hypothetical protein